MRPDAADVIERETYTLFPLITLVTLIALQQQQGAQELHAASCPSPCPIVCPFISGQDFDCSYCL